MTVRTAGSRARLLAVAALAVTGTLLTGVPVTAAHPGDTAIGIAPSEADAGSTVTVSGEGFTAGTDVALVLRTGQGDERLASATVDGAGHFTTGVALGGSLDTRYYEVQAVGSAETATQLLSVTADPDDAGGDLVDRFGLPALLLGGAGLLALAALVVVVRRRGPVSAASR